MSLKTWIRYYYPIRAIEEVGNHVFKSTDSKQEVLEKELILTKSALNKWRGLRKKILDKHKVEKIIKAIFNSPDVYNVKNKEHVPYSLSISSSTCTLCVAYNSDCSKCPINKTIKNKKLKRFANCHKEYYIWCETSNPEPMIELLQNTVTYLEEQLKESNNEK